MPRPSIALTNQVQVIGLNLKWKLLDLIQELIFLLEAKSVRDASWR